MLILGVNACREPRTIDEAKRELDKHSSKMEDRFFKQAEKRSERIRQACLRTCSNKPAPERDECVRKCNEEHEDRLKEANKLATKYTTESRKHNEAFFDNFREEWEKSQERRAEIKKKAMEESRKAIDVINEQLSFADKKMASRVSKTATNKLIREDLISPGVTIEIAATGKLLDPVAPGTIRVQFDNSVGSNKVMIDDIIVQEMQFAGDVVLKASLDPNNPNLLQLDLIDLTLEGSNLDFGAVSTGLNLIKLNKEEPGSGTIYLTTHEVTLNIPVTIENDFTPFGTLFVNVSLTGRIETVSSDRILSLSFQGPFVSLFPIEAPEPLTELTILVGDSREVFDLNDGTILTIPSGALAAPVEISALNTGSIPSPFAVPSENERIAITRQFFPLNQSFDVPVSITIPFNKGAIKDLDKSTLQAFVFNETTEAWELIPDSALDPDNETVTFKTMNFFSSFFGIGAELVSGDLDGDGDVDRNDLRIILDARNTLAIGLSDRRDLDKDGRINILDARILTTLCTRPLCATE